MIIPELRLAIENEGLLGLLPKPQRGKTEDLKFGEK